MASENINVNNGKRDRLSVAFRGLPSITVYLPREFAFVKARIFADAEKYERSASWVIRGIVQRALEIKRGQKTERDIYREIEAIATSQGATVGQLISRILMREIGMKTPF